MEGRRNTFKSVLLKLNSSVLSLAWKKKEAGVNILSLLCKHTHPHTFIHRDAFYIVHFLDSCLAEFVVDDVYAVRLLYM